MVGVTKIGRGNANYWIEAVAEGGEDYYTKPGEAPGQWLGSLARELGLEGQVDRPSYIAILAGRDPLSGEELVHRLAPRRYVDSTGRERVKEPVLGYDVRFAAPKSVSLLYAIGPPEVRAAILAAHDGAVADAVSYLEAHACFVQRGKGGARVERGSGFVAMAFRHRSSRAGDMALHTHLVTSNMTRATSDGSWRALASPKGRSPFYLHAKTCGHVYHASLRAHVTRALGAEWHPVHNGYADIVGIERAVIEHFSRRRSEITEEMERYGASSAKAAEVAAYRTRDAKDYGVDPDTQREEWIARAAEFDLTPDSIEQMLSGAVAREPRSIGASDQERALSDLEQHRSHFDRRDVLCALANQLTEGTDAASLGEAVDHLLSSEQVIEIHKPSDPISPTYYTTPRLWELEQRFIDIARKGQSAGAAVVDRQTLAAVLERHHYLGADQREMLTRLLSGGERIVAVAALPGTGKTTALAAAREAWQAAGHPVIGVATARSASGELADAGIPATSITALLIRAEGWRQSGLEPLAPGTVIFVDEATTTSTPDAAELAEMAERCAGKLVAIGDPRQIGAVGPGGAYGHLTKITRPSILTEIRRQHREVDRRIVELAHEGRGSDALDLMRTEGQLVIADTQPEALDALVLDWHRSIAQGEDAVMIARRNRDVEELNARAREVLIAEGALAEGELSVGGRAFAVGDRVLTRVNSAQVSNRERWEITALDAERESVELRRIGGDERTVTLDASYLQHRTPAGEPAIQHAYAMTTYATQSKTFDTAFVLIDPGSTQEEFVVAVSRSRGPTIAYGAAASELTDPELGPGLRQLEDEAHELRAAAERPAAEFAALDVSLREQLTQLPESELIARRRQLDRHLCGEVAPSPNARRLASVKERIGEAEAQLATYADQRSELLAQRRPDPQELTRLKGAQTLAEQGLDRLRSECERLEGSLKVERPEPAPATPEQRLEHSLIEERLGQLRRRQIAAQRLQPSAMVHKALGERPRDPEQAHLWNEGVETIYSYRHRHGISSQSNYPLGAQPPEAKAREEWLVAQRRLRQIQAGLGVSEDLAKTIEQGASIEM
jgi:conjugative relaxase-like TrwC/TraI family protein